MPISRGTRQLVDAALDPTPGPGTWQAEQAELAGLDALERDETATRSLPVRAWSSLWPKLAAVTIALFLWQCVVWAKWKPEYVLPGPRKVLPILGDVVRTMTFWQAVGNTMQRALIGFTLSLLIGSLVGIAVVRVRVLRTAVGSLITGLQTMPSIVWFPLALLLFSLSERAIIFVVVLGAAPSIANGLIGGVDNVPPILIRAGNVLGARGFTLLRSVILPAALPTFIGGLKQGWAFAWRSLMAGELLVIIGSKPTLGVRMDFARQFSDTSLLIAYMIVILIIGIAVDSVFGAADRRVRARRGLLVGV